MSFRLTLLVVVLGSLIDGLLKPNLREIEHAYSIRDSYSPPMLTHLVSTGK